MMLLHQVFRSFVFFNWYLEYCDCFDIWITNMPEGFCGVRCIWHGWVWSSGSCRHLDTIGQVHILGWSGEYTPVRPYMLLWCYTREMSVLLSFKFFQCGRDVRSWLNLCCSYCSIWILCIRNWVCHLWCLVVVCTCLFSPAYPGGF